VTSAMRERRELLLELRLDCLASADPFGLLRDPAVKDAGVAVYGSLIAEFVRFILHKRLLNLPYGSSIGTDGYSTTYGRSPDYLDISDREGLFRVERSPSFPLEEKLQRKLDFLGTALKGLKTGRTVFKGDTPKGRTKGRVRFPSTRGSLVIWPAASGVCCAFDPKDAQRGPWT